VFLHPSSVNFSCGRCTATLYVRCNELSVFRGVRKCCMGQQALGLIAAAAATHGTVHPSKACNTFLLSLAAGKFESGWLAYSEIVETSKVSLFFVFLVSSYLYQRPALNGCCVPFYLHFI